MGFRRNVYWWAPVLVGALSFGVSSQASETRQCKFNELVARITSSLERGVPFKLKPVEVYQDPAANPETGKSFRPKGLRGALNVEELIGSLPTEADRKAVREAYRAGKINLNQLLELQLVCTLTDRSVAEQLAQYQREGGSYGASSFTEIPEGLREKVLQGEPRPGKPREVRGAHSPTILENPKEYQVISNEPNPNGTLSVKFKKWVVTPEAPAGAWSKPKSSTLAPPSWSEADIDFATRVTVARGKHIKTEVREGKTVTFLRAQVVQGEDEIPANGSKPIEWEVIVEENVITSSYPTGN